MRVRGFVPLYVSTVLWHTTRWGGLFSCGYLLTQLTDAPFLNQLAGAFIFAPMFVGGVAAGSFSDRVDRRRFILVVQMALIPISLVMFVLVQSGVVRPWTVFPFMLALGCGGLVNLTAQRPLVYETAGPRLAARALTLEAVGAASASMIGSLTGGALIATFGIGAAFLFLVLALCLSATLLTRVPNPARTTVAPPGLSLQQEVGRSVGLLKSNPTLASLLGVTIVVDLCYFSSIPIVPIVAKQFEASAFATGVLAASAGLGQLGAGMFISTRRHIEHRGRVYIAGSTIALLGLGLFSIAPFIGLAFAALFVSGIGQAGFLTMQSVLAIESVRPSERGAAQGLLSTAMGALPVGMVLLGISAQLLGSTQALLISAGIGLTSVALWLNRRPQVLRSGHSVTEMRNAMAAAPCAQLDGRGMSPPSTRLASTKDADP